jgi:hypothetical protein
MTDAPIPNQANYQDAQSFEVDIDKIYSDFIKAIDKIRSCNNANNIRDASVTVALSKATTIKDARSALSTLCDLNTFSQESRCHAFFRIIGFPCADSSESKIFNPGLDIITDPNRKVDNTFKLGVIKDPVSGFRDLSVTRETYSSTTADIFAAQDSIDAATLALSSGRTIRQFIAPLTSTTFDDTDVSSQQYSIDFTSSVGGTVKLLTEYQDVQGKTPTKITSFKFGHIIKPFLVDPVIDLTVNDSTKLIAVPFVPSKTQLKVKDGNDGFVSRPMLEQVIRDRYTITNATETSGTADQSVLDYIKSIPDVTDVGIINSATSLYKLDDQTQFVKFLNIIRAMIKKLVDAQDAIRNAQDNYYWVPVPATNGPEGGCTVQGVFLSTQISSDFITFNDQAIIEATIKKVVAQADASAANANATADVGGFALPNALGLPNLGGSSAPDALGDNITKNLDQLTSKRNADLKKASDALRTVEIIMGEFSGLGLCDIIAVLGGLYLMPKESLLGFLDDDALARMNAAGLTGSASSLSSASNDFISVVKDLYNLMDKIYQDMSQNNGIA